MKRVLVRITASLLVAFMLIGFVPVMSTGLTMRAATAEVVLSLNLSKETATEVVLTVKLDSGSIGAIDFGIKFNKEKIKSCTSIVGSLPGGQMMTNNKTCLVAGATTVALGTAGTVLATYTFEKVSGKWITKNDFTLSISNCADGNANSVANRVTNNLPAVAQEPVTEPPTKPKTEPTKEPSTEPKTEPTTEPETTTESTTEESTTKSTTADTTTTASNIGTCGINATWFFDEPTGTLLISGAGEMNDYYSNEPEWLKRYGDLIKEVNVRQGITSIGAGSFENCTQLESVYLPSTVTSIGRNAFEGCDALKNVYYEGSEDSFRAAFPRAEEIFDSDNTEIIFNKNVSAIWEEFDVLTTQTTEEDKDDDAGKIRIPKKTGIILIAVSVLLIEIIIVCIILIIRGKKKKQPSDAVAVQNPNQYTDQYSAQYTGQASNQYPNQTNDQSYDSDAYKHYVVKNEQDWDNGKDNDQGAPPTEYL